MRVTPITVLLVSMTASLHAADSLPSWEDGAARTAIIDFVARVEATGIPESERIATFDNDGTLWAEQPMYVQAIFLLDRIKALAPQHPDWQEKEPFAAVLRGDMKRDWRVAFPFQRPSER